jgi:rubrerythrin
MSITFNADEMFAMAERIEANAEAFYRRAAELHAELRTRKLLLELADMEVAHRRTFAAMRKDLSGKEKELTAYDPNGEAALYLDAMADAHPGEGSPPAARALTGKESLASVLRAAVELEKKSVLFYVGLRDLVPEALGRDRVEAIIAEEKTHIVLLTQYLRGLPPR